MISNALSNGFTAIQLGTNRMEGSALAIARMAISDPTTGAPASREVIRPLIEQRLALYEVQAGSKVIQTVNRMLGSLFDAFV